MLIIERKRKLTVSVIERNESFHHQKFADITNQNLMQLIAHFEYGAKRENCVVNRSFIQVTQRKGR